MYPGGRRESVSHLTTLPHTPMFLPHSIPILTPLPTMPSIPLWVVWVALILGAVGPPLASSVGPPFASAVGAPFASVGSSDALSPEVASPSTQDPTTVASLEVTSSANVTSSEVVPTSARPLPLGADALTLKVSTERNTTLVSAICRPKSRLFPGLPTASAAEGVVEEGRSSPTPRPDPSSTTVRSLLKAALTGRGVEMDLSLLEEEEDGAGQVVVDVEGCGAVVVGRGVPAWVEGLTFAIKGKLVLRFRWWAGSDHLRQLSVRVDDWVWEGAQGLCHALPPTLEALDVSNSPVQSIQLDESCVPPGLQRLDASRAALARLALCTPSLITLHVSWNRVGGGLQWASCHGGVSAVQYLQADNNNMTVASTCGWGALRTLDLRHNFLAGLDLTSCPPANLTSVTVAHNLLVMPPALPNTLLYLDFSHNHLSSLPVLTHALVEADLSHNKVTSIGKSRFKRAHKLLHLSLSHNRLTILLERELLGLRNLRSLDLSHNSLRHIAPSSLMHLQSLRRLHLQRNHLTTLDARDLDAFQLQPHAHASLHHNPWECSCYLLSFLNRLQACPGCQQQEREKLQCREDGTWVKASDVLRSCMNAVKDATPPIFDESDEDLSEEEGDDLASGQARDHRAVMVVPGVVVLLLLAVSAALGYRLYHRHRRAIRTGLAPFCGFCGLCAPDALNNNHTNHQRDRLSQIGNDSDTETEL